MSFYPDTDEGVPTTAPFRRRVGHEVEINNCGHNGDRAFVEYLWDQGYGTPRLQGYGYGNGLHGYHCRCRHANNYPIHTTYDGTAPGGEHIVGGTKGVLFGSPAYMEAIGIIAEAADATGGQGTNGTGGHIHVSMQGVGKVKAVNLWRNLGVLWGQLRELASGPWDEVRSNGNMHPPQPGDDLARITIANPVTPPPMPPRPSMGLWVEDPGPISADRTRSGRLVSNPNYERDYAVWSEWHSTYGRNPHQLQVGPWDCEPRAALEIRSTSNAFRFQATSRMPKTIEFRVWNTTVSRWRLYMGAGVSAALVEAAAQNRNLAQDADTDLLDHLDGLLTADLVALVERQRAILRGDFSMAA